MEKYFSKFFGSFPNLPTTILATQFSVTNIVYNIFKIKVHGVAIQLTAMALVVKKVSTSVLSTNLPDWGFVHDIVPFCMSITRYTKN